MAMPPPSVAVAFDRPADREAAAELAARLGLPLAKKFRDPHGLHLALAANPSVDEGDARLELRVVADDHPLRGGHGVMSDLLKLDVTSPAGRSLRTPVLKAVGVKRGTPRPRVMDVTAGLGEDTWLLAAAGCEVIAVERHPLIHALLTDGLRRAAKADADTAARITLLPRQDAMAALRADRSPAPEVVLIDPMFPGERKTAERKAMAVCREKYLAMLFFLGADRARYGRLIEKTENDFLQGTDNYPKTLNEAYTLILCWKQDPRNLIKVIGGTAGGMTFGQAGQEIEGEEEEAATLTNNGTPGKGKGKKDKSHITCFICRQKGHYASE